MHIVVVDQMSEIRALHLSQCVTTNFSSSNHFENTEFVCSFLLKKQVLSMQQGSWRQRAMKLKQERAVNAAS
jgi:hypothetical protein